MNEATTTLTRAEIERLFRRLKGLRRIFSKFEKLDVMSAQWLKFGSARTLLR